MTEEDWLACSDPGPMLEYVRGRTSDRKLRLFAVACCRRCNYLCSRPDWVQGLEAIERHADGDAADGELEPVARAAWAEAAQYTGYGPWSPQVGSAAFFENLRRQLGHEVVGLLALAPGPDPPSGPLPLEAAELLECVVSVEAVVLPLLRCVFGDPFRPASFDPSWRTETVVLLARGMYESRDFGAAPILADALEEAGCENEDVLEHCRGSGPHVRGCHVVDWVLGKE